MRGLAGGCGVAVLALAAALLLGQCSAPKRTAGGSGSVAAGDTLGRGAQAYLAYCAMCHGDRGAGDGPLAAPMAAENVTVARLDDAARLETLGPAGIRRVIITGGGHTGRSNLMPAWSERLDRRLIDEIVAYVMSLPGRSPGVPAATVQKYLEAPPGNPEQGRRLFVYYCSGCHGPHGRGDGFNGDTLRVRHAIRPRDLTNTAYFSAKTDQELYEVIALGGGHMGRSVFMPAWTFKLAPADIKSLASYVRVLSKTTSRP